MARGTRIRVFVAGDYGHRQPLAYAPVRDAVAGRILLVDAPDTADVVVLAHWKDAVAHGPELAARMGAEQRLVLLSEEPFWDTLWCPAPFSARSTVPGTERDLALVNHFTSRLYDFDRIPYFLLTDPAYTRRYADRLGMLAARSAGDWADALTAAPLDAAFLLERRDHPAHDRVFPAEGAMGLAAHRTRIAMACRGPRVLVTGKGWGEAAPRQALDDWHADKLDRLDGQSRTMFAMENTWWPTYVTEKPFDALACGALPAALGGPGHRLHTLFPEPCWIDLYGLAPRKAAAAILHPTIDGERLDALRAAAARLAALFADPAPLRAELDRVARALTAELGA